MAPRVRSPLVGGTLATTIGLIGAAGLCAVAAGTASADFMYELDDDRPALADAPPAIEAAATPRLARRVILVIVDGLRARSATGLPALDHLRRAGSATIAESLYPTWSRPNYVSILAGVPPYASGVRTNHHETRIALDTVMDRVRAAGLTCELASDYEVLPEMFLRYGVDGSYQSPCDAASYTPWSGGPADAADAVAASQAAFSVLHIGPVDRAGHLHGGASDAYRAAAREADRAIARVVASVDLARDAVIVTADHGHIDCGGHGGVERDVVEVPLVAAGAGIQRGARVGPARLIDIAPTVAALLGIPAPGHGLGRTLVELLALSPADGRARVAADHARLARTRAIVAADHARVAAAFARRCAERTAGVIALVLLAIALGVALARRGVLRVDRRAVAIAMLAVGASNAIAFAAGAGSASAISSRTHVAWLLLGAGSVALALHLAACAWAVRGRRDALEQLATANAIAGIALVLAAIPASVVWVAFSPARDVLPDASWLVTIPVAFAGFACACIVAAGGLAGSLFALLAAGGRRAPLDALSE